MKRPHAIASDNALHDRRRILTAVALVGLLLALAPSLTHAQIALGPFVPSQPKWAPPGGNGTGVAPDGSLQTLLIDTDGDGTAFGPNDHSHPYPPDPRTDVTAHSYGLSPSREFLFITGTSVQSCSGQASDTKLYVYRIPPTDGAFLEPLVVGECFAYGISTEGFFDQGPSQPQSLHVIERPDPTALTQDIFWVDLKTGSSGWSFPGFSQNVEAIRFDPNGYAALVQYDVEPTSDGLSDYRLIELCADMIGVGYSNTAGALSQLSSPIVDAEVVDDGGVADIRISQSGSALLQTELVDCSQFPVDTGACCFPDGSCADGVTQSACESTTNAGTWQGAGSTCGSVSCPQPPAPDLQLSAAGPASVPVQQDYDVDLTWSNTGDAPATGVFVTFTVPFGVQFVAATGGGTYNTFTRRVTWSVGTLVDGTSGGAQVTMNADCTTTSAVHGSFLTSAEIPFLTGNNVGTNFSPAASGPIQLSIQSVPDTGVPVLNGDTITHTFVLVNPTGEAIPTIDLVVNLGNYQELDTVVSSGSGTAAVSNSWLTWSGALPPSGQTTIVVRMRISECRPESVTETHMNNGSDVFFRGACSVTLATVTPTAPIPLGPTQISVDVRATNLLRATGTFFDGGFTPPYLARPGDAASFETTITNNYPTPATGLTATITLPASLIPASDPPFVGTPPAGTTWDAATQTITWAGDLPGSSSITIAWDVTVDANDPCGSGGPNVRVTTASCPFLASGGVGLVLMPMPHVGPHLLTLTPFEGIYRVRPGQDASAERWICYNFEIFTAIDEGKGGDLWLTGVPIARLNPAALELELIAGDLFTRLQMTNVDEVAVDRTSGVVYFAGVEGLGSPNRSYLRVRAWDPATDQVTFLFDDSAPPTPTYGRPQEMILDDTGHLAVTVTNAVLRIDPAVPGTADVYAVPEFGTSGVSSIVADANGDYVLARASFLSTEGIPLVRMDPATGATTTLAANLRDLGPTPSQPWLSAAFDGTDKLYLMAPNLPVTNEVDLDVPVSMQAFFGASPSNTDVLWYTGVSTSTHVPDTPSRLPDALRVASVEPNPFNPRTTVSFDVPRDMRARLVVHDVRGREIDVLRDGLLTAGRHRIVWDGRDANAQPVASGVYFVRLVGGAQQDVKKMVLVR